MSINQCFVGNYLLRSNLNTVFTLYKLRFRGVDFLTQYFFDFPLIRPRKVYTITYVMSSEFSLVFTSARAWIRARMTLLMMIRVNCRTNVCKFPLIFQKTVHAEFLVTLSLNLIDIAKDSIYKGISTCWLPWNTTQIGPILTT